jgi:hypothetical protein
MEIDPPTDNAPAPQDAPVDDLADFANSFLDDTETPEPPPVDEAPPVEETPPAPENEEPEPPAEEEQPAPENEEQEPLVEEEPETPARTKDSWDQLRSSRDRHKAASEEKDNFLKEKEAEIAELRSKTAKLVELEEKLKVFDEQERELAIARVESTREYKEVIEAPLHAIGTEVEAITKANEGDVEAVYRAIREPDHAKQRAMLKEITAGWDEIDRMDLKKMADDARTILDKQEAMRSNAHAASKEREQVAAQREAEAKEVSRRDFTKATDDVVKSIREKLPFTPLAEGETEQDRYTSLAQKVSQVDFDTQSPRAKALAAASALVLPQAIKTIAAKDKEISDLKEALSKASKAKPRVESKTDIHPPREKDDFFENLGISEPSAMFGSIGLDVRGQ